MTTLAGRTALITGASRGIGRAVAVRLAAEGALVAVHYGTNKDAAEQTVTDIREAGGDAFAVRADLTDDDAPATIAAALDAGLRDRTGDPALDILVNNAGVTGAGHIDAITPADYDRIFTINLKAPFFLTRALLPVLRDGGRIINMSSCNARIAFPVIIDYTMTKAALEAMTRTLAQQLAPRRITVNAIAPGATRTDLMAWLDDVPDLKAFTERLSAFATMADPSDIAAVAAFLASPDSAWVTGHVLDASGGTFLGPPQ